MAEPKKDFFEKKLNFNLLTKTHTMFSIKRKCTKCNLWVELDDFFSKSQNKMTDKCQKCRHTWYVEQYYKNKNNNTK